MSPVLPLNFLPDREDSLALPSAAAVQPDPGIWLPASPGHWPTCRWMLTTSALE
jgi:hypothetical protein